MVHQYQLNGYNIVLDTCSGGIHVVDEVAYDIIAMFQDHSPDEIVAAMLEKYGTRPDVTEQDLRDCMADMRQNQMLFDLETEPELIDQRIYEYQAIQSRYRYLQRQARAAGLRAIL